MGYELPQFVNPAEFAVDLAAVDARSPELERLSMARVSSLIEAWKLKQSRDYSDPLDIGDPSIRNAANTGTFLQSILALLREPRSYKENLESHLSQSTRLIRQPH
jgi:hypothetical protein